MFLGYQFLSEPSLYVADYTFGAQIAKVTMLCGYSGTTWDPQVVGYVSVHEEHLDGRAGREHMRNASGAWIDGGGRFADFPARYPFNFCS